MSTPIRRTPGVLEAEVDGDRVLMHPATFAYFGLSDTGAAVWALIDDDRDAAAIVAELTTEYAADEATIGADVSAFLAGLEDADLIAPVS